MINAWDFKRRCLAAVAASTAESYSTDAIEPCSTEGAPSVAATVDPQAPSERQGDCGGRRKKARRVEGGVAGAGGKALGRMIRKVARLGTAVDGATVTGEKVASAGGSG